MHCTAAAAKLHWLQECELNTKKQPHVSNHKPTSKVYLSHETTWFSKLGLTTAADTQLLEGVKGCMLWYEWYILQKVETEKHAKRC